MGPLIPLQPSVVYGKSRILRIGGILNTLEYKMQWTIWTWVSDPGTSLKYDHIWNTMGGNREMSRVWAKPKKWKSHYLLSFFHGRPDWNNFPIENLNVHIYSRGINHWRYEMGKFSPWFLTPLLNANLSAVCKNWLQDPCTQKTYQTVISQSLTEFSG